jgi:hypothetical protein
MVPIVLRVKGYRFGFFGADRDEPPHVHVEKQDREAKFWLDPVRLSRNAGFRPHELNEVQKIIAENQNQLLEAWHDFFPG